MLALLRPVVAVVLLAVPLLAVPVSAHASSATSSAANPSKAFCKAAYTYDRRVERKAKLPEQIRLVQTMADHAPKDIARDAATFLDALQRRARGDKSVVDNPKIQKAVENVERRAVNGCALYKQDPPSGI
jgi:hypothetical protein